MSFVLPMHSREARAVDSPVSRNNIDTIQVLRFVAAVSVVLFHANQVVAPWGTESLIFGTAAYFLGMGAAGVHVFFCISGFVMVYTSYYRGKSNFNAADFMTKRVIRIYPIYWICCAIYLFSYQLIGKPYSISIQDTFGAMFLLPTDASKIIGPAWTLFYEMYFYICFCLFMRTGLLKGLSALTVFFMSAVSARVLFPSSWIAQQFGNILLLEFVAGAWVGFVAIRYPAQLARLGPSALTLGLTGFIAGAWLDYHRVTTLIAWGLPSLMLLAGAIGIEFARRLPRWISRLAFLGDGSYFLYLSHILIIDAAVLLLAKFGVAGDIDDILFPVAVATVATAASIPAFTYLERPIITRLRRLFRSVRSASPRDVPAQ